MKYRFGMAATMVVLVGGLVFGAAASWRNLYPSYTGLAFGSGNFVAVSSDGLIKTGDGGADWSQYFMPVPGGLNSTAFGDGIFVVAGNPSVFRSSDGKNWNFATNLGNYICKSLIFGENGFAGVGVNTANNNAVTFFYDDYGFDPYPAQNIASHLDRVAFGADRYVAVGSGIVTANPVGVQQGVWNAATGTGSASAVAFGEDIGFAAIASGGSTVYTSSNGTTWSSSSSTGAPAGILDMTFGGGKFVAVGSAGNAAWSTDGSRWTAAAGLSANDDFVAVRYGNGGFVALGARGSVYTSSNGELWEKQSDGRSMTYRQIVRGGLVFVAVGDSGVSVSSDGRNWERKAIAGKNFQGVAYGGGKFVTVGDNGAIFVSADNGNSWEDHSLIDNTGFKSITYGHGAFIAVGERVPSAPGIYVSTDGQNWGDMYYEGNVSTAWTTTVYPTAIAFGNDRFIAGSSFGEIFVSTNSENPGRFWVKVADVGVTGISNISTVTYTDGQFTVLGTSTGKAAVISSSDGALGTWTVTASQPPTTAKAATFAKGYFVVVADSGNIFASADGNQWGSMAKATNKNLTTVYFDDDNVLLAAGVNGALLYSSETPTSIRNNTQRASSNKVKTAGMTMTTQGRSQAVTLPFTPKSAGTIAVYSLTGKRIYKRNVSAGERTIRLESRFMTLNGSVIVRYAGNDGTAVSQRFNIVR